MRRPAKTVSDYQAEWQDFVNSTKQHVYVDGLIEPTRPDFEHPRLEPDIDKLTDESLMALFVQFTRWADFFQNQLAVEEIYERCADAEVRRLEGLYMIAHKPERASEAVTWVKAQMETSPEIQTSREALRIVYARRKLKGMLFEQAERDAAVCSRELTRRNDAKNPGYRRADRGAP